MNKKVFIYGKWENPESWQILDSVPQPTLTSLQNSFFTHSYDTYEDARKWALKELQARRNTLGVTMHDWFQRKHLKGESNVRDKRSE